MRNFLSDYISSLNSGVQVRVSSLLNSAKVEKSQLDSISTKLSKSGIFANVVLPTEDQYGLIDSGNLGIALRDVSISIEDMYTVSNEISLLLDSHAAILNSDVLALEKELTALEKAVQNYAFLLSDAKAYDYAYLESFSDTRGQDIVDWVIPDRGQQNFAFSDYASLDTGEGVLTLPINSQINFPITAKMILNNFSGFVTSDTGIENSTNPSSTNGWRVSISSPSPIKSSLPEFTFNGVDTYAGALAVLEFTLSQPAPCDMIRLEGFSDAPFDVVQVRVYSGVSDTDYIDILDGPETISGTTNFFFPTQSISKFTVYINQDSYSRTGTKTIQSEEFYKRLSDGVFRIQPFTPGDDMRLQRMILIDSTDNPEAANRGPFSSTTPTPSSIDKFGKNSFGDLISKIKRDSFSTLPWTNSSLTARTMGSLIKNVLFKQDFNIYSTPPQVGGQEYYDTVVNNLDNFPVVNTSPTMDAAMASNPSQIPIEVKDGVQFKYDYNVGIKTISIGTGLSGFKGVFISKKIPAPGDIGELKLRVEDTNFVATSSSRDSKTTTSVEYSVTNKSQAVNESDWVPVLPVDQVDVVGERFFPSSVGKGFLRFPAAIDSSVSLYKNGYSVGYSLRNLFIFSPGQQSIVGINIPQGEFTSQDIFTVAYTPTPNASVVNFQSLGFTEIPLVSSFDEQGAGEGYDGTNGQLIINLANTPYIDYSQVETSTYSNDNGLTPYQPIVIRLEDGTILKNLTNYKGGSQASLLSVSDSITYIQNMGSIIFNKPITQSFRVYYQYMPSNTRVRVVLRSNDANFTSPKVSSFQIKAKTRKSDARRRL